VTGQLSTTATARLIVFLKLQRSKTMDLKSGFKSRSLGMLLLGLWLILTGLLPLLSVRISSTISTALAVLAIIAGILILLGR